LRQLTQGVQYPAYSDRIRDVDISRTIGWFSSRYPFLLDAGVSHYIERLLIEVKETRRRIPNKGIGYGILKYLAAAEYLTDLRFDRQPEISFNYLGQFNESLIGADTELFRLSSENKGLETDEYAGSEHGLEVTGILIDGILHIGISYCISQFDGKEISKVLSGYKENLLALVDHCIRKQPVVTPSDLGDPYMPIEILNNLFDEDDVN
jgi:non-ribosomal peptide synthase protein (TIGR01720 family)